MEDFVVFNPTHFLANEVYKLPNQTLYTLVGEKNTFYFLNSGKLWMMFVNEQPSPDTTYSDGRHDIEWGDDDGNDMSLLQWLNKNSDLIEMTEYSKDLISTLKANNRNYKLNKLIS